MHSRHNRPDQKPDGNSAGPAHEKLDGSLRRRKGACHCSDDCQPIDHEGSRVVDEAFALEDTYDLPRHAQWPHDRKHGDRIRGRDDRTERDRGRPGERWMQPVGYDSNGCGRDEYQDDRKTEDRTDLAPKVTKRVGNCSRVKERRDENKEQHFWRECDVRKFRNEREKESADNEDGCVGDPQPLCDEAQPRRNSEQKQKELKTSQATIISETLEVSTLSREVCYGHRIRGEQSA